MPERERYSPAVRETALAPAYAAQKSGDYEQAYQIFKQQMDVFPKDARVSMLAAAAARQAGHLEEALSLYQHTAQLNPIYPNHDLAQVIQIYAALNRWDDFDQARKTAREASIAGDQFLPATTGYVIEDINDGQRHIVVREYPVPFGRFHTRYRFQILSQADPQTRFTPYYDLESDDGDQMLFRRQHPDLAAAGQREYSLDTYPRINTQGLISFFDGEPTYETVRAIVLSSEANRPMATTTVTRAPATAPNQ